MPKILRGTDGTTRRVTMPSGRCCACKGSGLHRATDGRVAECANCYGRGHLAINQMRTR